MKQLPASSEIVSFDGCIPVSFSFTASAPVAGGERGQMETPHHSH